MKMWIILFPIFGPYLLTSIENMEETELPGWGEDENETESESGDESEDERSKSEIFIF